MTKELKTTEAKIMIINKYPSITSKNLAKVLDVPHDTLFEMLSKIKEKLYYGEEWSISKEVSMSSNGYFKVIDEFYRIHDLQIIERLSFRQENFDEKYKEEIISIYQELIDAAMKDNMIMSDVWLSNCILGRITGVGATNVTNAMFGAGYLEKKDGMIYITNKGKGIAKYNYPNPDAECVPSVKYIYFNLVSVCIAVRKYKNEFARAAKQRSIKC